MRIAIGLGVLVVVVLATTAQADDEKEKKISVSECPKAVQKTLKQEWGNGKLIDVDVREIDGVAVYESEVWFGELEYDLVIREDGTLLDKRLENDGNHEDSEEGDDDERGDDEDEDEEEDDRDARGEDDSEKEVETSLRLADLPRAVRRTLKREARGGEIEIEVEGDRIIFEAEVEYETKDREIEYEIQIAVDGTLLSKILEVDEGDSNSTLGRVRATCLCPNSPILLSTRSALSEASKASKCPVSGSRITIDSSWPSYSSSTA